MADSVTGEHPVPVTPIPMARNGPTWRWLVGAIATTVFVLGGALVGVYGSMSTDIVRLQEQLAAHVKMADNWLSLQATLNGRFETGLKIISDIDKRVAIIETYTVPRRARYQPQPTEENP